MHTTEQRKAKLQRLFPAFPAGRPGVGLLLLRLAVGVTAIIHGAIYLSNHGHPMILDWVVGLMVIAAGALVLVGFLTPVMGPLTGIGILGTLLLQSPSSTSSLLDGKTSEILTLTMAAAIIFLGPGAFSVDARLFGRREIIIPLNSRSPEP